MGSPLEMSFREELHVVDKQGLMEPLGLTFLFVKKSEMYSLLI